MNTIKIIRAVWEGNLQNTLEEIPPVPYYKEQEVVYVWGEYLEKEIKKRGFNTRLVKEDNYFNTHTTQYGKKLVALDLALQEFDEVLLLDWDCAILRPLDNRFWEYLESKPIQCPLYGQSINTAQSFIQTYGNREISKEKLIFFDKIESNLKKYSWKFNESILATPNFSFVYSRNKNLGKDLINIAITKNLEGCVEEHAMFIYANCSMKDYINKYQPLVLEGVDQDNPIEHLEVVTTQRTFNNYIKEILPMDLYFKHNI